MKFTGFPEAAVLFYEGLAADNSKTYWNDHRAVYEECVKVPLQALLTELEPEFGTLKFFRPYRDVRFSKDKSPYRTGAAAEVSMEPAGRGIGYLHIGADRVLVAAGYWQTSPDQVARLRRAVADDVRGPQLEAILAAGRRAGLQFGGDQLKRVPAGYPPDHPRADLLRHKSLTGWRQWPVEAWLHSRDALTRIRRAWRSLTPLNDWLDSNVGASGQTG